MSSGLAEKLTGILRESEAKSHDLDTRLEALKIHESKVKDLQIKVKAREEAVQREALALTAFRDVAKERTRNQDMVNKNKLELEKFDDQRNSFAKEQAQQEDALRKLRIELEGALERTTDREGRLGKAEDKLRAEKVAHHEKVLKELAIIEQKKMGIS